MTRSRGWSSPAGSGRCSGSCPRTSTATTSGWRAALAALPNGRHAFEFRHQSWFTADVYALLRKHKVALVIGDHPKWPFQAHERTTDWTFVRFHYGRRGRNGKYSDSELDTWARRLAQWRRQTEVFAYFNNDWRGYALENARRLKRSLGV